jgi:hypothetical protein
VIFDERRFRFHHKPTVKGGFPRKKKLIGSFIFSNGSIVAHKNGTYQVHLELMREIKL